MIEKIKELIKLPFRKLGLYTFLYEKVYENRFVFQSLICSWRYRKFLAEAKKKPKNEKIRVLFIVSEIAKWKEQPLYELMESSDDFYPIIGISAWNNQSERQLSPVEYLQVVERAEAFFDKMGDRHVRTVTVENGYRVYHNLSEFDPDVVFYTEQWSPCPKQDPREVSGYALTCFLPYYVPDFGIMHIDCHQPVERFSAYYFCLGDSWVKAYRRNMLLTAHSVRYVATGHPTLDLFRDAMKIRPQKDIVIYAPHFSYPHPKQSEFYTIGTFDWNGKQILEYAEKHPEINWVYKPHPVLRRTLIETGVMTSAEVDAYDERWAKIGVVSRDADYQKLFLDSCVMITDCGSFLPEYGSTGRPVIRLICSDNKHVPPKASRDVYDTYYNVHNLREMYAVFRTVIEERRDPNFAARLAAVRNAGLCGSDASSKIANFLRGLFGR